jgi:hypothetical protein
MHTLSKPFAAVLALGIGMTLGVEGAELFRPDHFAKEAHYAGRGITAEYERCLAQDGLGHNPDPLSLREFCGFHVLGPFFFRLENQP